VPQAHTWARAGLPTSRSSMAAMHPCKPPRRRRGRAQADAGCGCSRRADSRVQATGSGCAAARSETRPYPICAFWIAHQLLRDDALTGIDGRGSPVSCPHEPAASPHRTLGGLTASQDYTKASEMALPCAQLCARLIQRSPATEPAARTSSPKQQPLARRAPCRRTCIPAARSHRHTARGGIAGDARLREINS
jgi:hypothetical protein